MSSLKYWLVFLYTVGLCYNIIFDYTVWYNKKSLLEYNFTYIFPAFNLLYFIIH